MPFQSFGLRFTSDDIWIAQRLPDRADDPASFRRMVLPFFPSVSAVASTSSALLPIEYRPVMAFHGEPSDWFANWLLRMSPWREQTTAGAKGRLGLVIPSTTPVELLSRLRDIAQQAAWNELQFVQDDLAIVAGRLRGNTEPLHVLVINVGADRTELSILTTFKGVAHIRQRLSTSAFSEYLSDEILLAVIRERFGTRGSPVDWTTVWNDAHRLHVELHAAPVAALEIADTVWSKRAVVEVTRDELWASLVRDIHSLVSIAQKLIGETTPSRVSLVLVAGLSPLRWPAGMQLLEEKLGTSIWPVGPDSSADGASWRMAQGQPASPEIYEQPLSEELLSWQVRVPSARTSPLLWNLDSTELPASGTTPKVITASNHVSPEIEFHQKAEPLWSFLRGVNTVQPAVATELLARLQQQAEQFMSELATTSRGQLVSEPIKGPDEGPSHHPLLELAYQHLAGGRRNDAVRISHSAHEQQPASADVFREMIEIHLRAADEEPNDHTAVQWLECAHSHDKVNRQIHLKLASRNINLAQVLRKTGDHPAACRAVERALAFTPYDPSAQSLAAELYAEPQKTDQANIRTT